MKEITDDNLLLIMTVLDLLGKPTQPHNIRAAYYSANKQLEYYKTLPASRKPVTEQ